LVRIDYDISDDSYYLFACAELKTREVEFLEESKIERMLGSEGPDDFIGILRDTVYSKYINDIEKSRSFEKVIISEYSTTVNFLDQRLKPEHQAADDLLFLEENLHNLKVIVKSIILDIELRELFVPILHSYDELRDAAATGDYREVDPVVAEMLKFAVELIDKQENYRLMELELEKFYLERVLNSIETLNSRLLSDYLKHIIDILNIKNKEFMAKFEGESLDFFVKEMERTDYADMIIKGTYALHSEGTFSSFEKSGDLFYFDFFDPVKYTVSNLEKVFQFFLRKKLELKYLSIIFTGVLYGVENSKIRNKVKV